MLCDVLFKMAHQSGHFEGIPLVTTNRKDERYEGHSLWFFDPEQLVITASCAPLSCVYYATLQHAATIVDGIEPNLMGMKGVRTRDIHPLLFMFIS